METKKWYHSKTLWVNAVSLVAVLLSGNAGIELTAEETTAVIVIINMILRIVTKQPLG